MPASNYRLIERVGFALVVAGFVAMGLGALMVVGWHEPWGLAAVPLAILMSGYGVDMIGHPKERRALSPSDMGEFILRLWSGVGPP